MAKNWSKKYISLYYIIEFNLYEEALYYTIDGNLKTDIDIHNYLLEKSTFEIFQKNVLENDEEDFIMDYNAINFDDWLKYVANNRFVIKHIKSWTSDDY